MRLEEIEKGLRKRQFAKIAPKFRIFGDVFTKVITLNKTSTVNITKQAGNHQRYPKTGQ